MISPGQAAEHAGSAQLRQCDLTAHALHCQAPLPQLFASELPLTLFTPYLSCSLQSWPQVSTSLVDIGLELSTSALTNPTAASDRPYPSALTPSAFLLPDNLPSEKASLSSSSGPRGDCILIRLNETGCFLSLFSVSGFNSGRQLREF